MSEQLAFTEAQERMLQAVAQGLDTYQAATVAGVSDETVRQWRLIADGAESWPGTAVPISPAKRQQVVAFLAALTQARQRGFLELVGRLHHNASTPNPKTGWFDTQAVDKLLSKSSFRDDWYENRKVEINQSGTVAHEHRMVRDLPDAELEQAYEALDALPPP